MQRSIIRQYTLTFIGLAVAPVLLVGIILAIQNFTREGGQALQAQQALTQGIATQVEDYLEQREAELRLLAQAPNLYNLGQEEQHGLLENLRTFTDAYENLALLNAQGQELVSVSRVVGEGAVQPQSQAEEDAFTLAATLGSVYYGPVHSAPSTSEPLLTIGIPIIDPDTGAVQGMLMGDVRLTLISALLDRVELGPGQAAYILDTDNQVIAHPDFSIVENGATFVPPPDGSRATGLSGDQALIVSEPVAFGGSQITVVVENPPAEALGLALDTALVAGVVTLIALVVAAGIGATLARRTIEPIRNLAATAQAIRQGEFYREATDAHREDEIGELSRAFNDMTSQIRENLAALEASVQEARLATAQAREANRLKSEFLSTMSHELRTPLNAMIGFSEIMISGMGGTLDEEALHMTQRIHSNSLRLLALINDVLDLSKIEARRVEVIARPFSPQNLVQSLVSQMSSLIQQKKLDFVVNVDPLLPSQLNGDPDLIERIATNLLSNAIKFTEQGSVTLSLQLASNNRWELSIADTGIGIPPHAQNYIFDPFRQLDGSSQRAYSGTGLGLTIVRELTLAMGGRVNLQSHVGSGSIFTISLPLVMVSQPAEAGAAAS